LYFLIGCRIHLTVTKFAVLFISGLFLNRSVACLCGEQNRIINSVICPEELWQEGAISPEFKKVRLFCNLTSIYDSNRYTHNIKHYAMDKHNSTKEKCLSDLDVIKHVLNGEKDFYEILMRRCNQILYRVIRGYIKEDAIIKDIMQEVYILAYLKLPEFRGTSAFSTWLVRIGINESLMYIRRSKKITTAYIVESCEQALYFQERMHPELKLIQLESKNQIESAIDALPEKLRLVFIMIEVERMSTDSVSELLSISKSNIKVRLHRAKLLLREMLSGISDLEHLYGYGADHCDDLVIKVIRAIIEIDCYPLKLKTN